MRTQLCTKAVLQYLKVFTNRNSQVIFFFKEWELNHLLLVLLVYLFKQKSCFYAVLETSFSLLLSLCLWVIKTRVLFPSTHKENAVDPLSWSAQAAVINYHWFKQQTLIFHGSSGCWWLEVRDQGVSVVRLWQRPSSWFTDHRLAISSYGSERETISVFFW